MLTLCGYDATIDFLVYVRDTPWQLVDNYPVQVSNGDLIIITTPHQDVVISAYLSDMLRSSVGWISAEFLPRDTAEAAWFVATPQQHSFRLPLRDDALYEAEAAIRANRPRDDIRLLPAVPAICDHSAFGVHYDSTFAVSFAVSDVILHDQTVTCILDLRPILSGFEQFIFPNNVLDTALVLDRFLPGAPFGFGVGVFGGSPSASTHRSVQHGSVLIVEYLTDEQSQNLAAHLAAYAPPPGRWPTQIGAAGIVPRAPIDPIRWPDARAVATTRSTTNIGHESVVEAGLRRLALKPRIKRSSSIPARGRKVSQHFASLLCRWLLIGLVVTQPRVGVAGHSGHLFAMPLAALCITCAAMPADQDINVRHQADGLNLCMSLADVDMCAFVHHDEACTTRPHWDTPTTSAPKETLLLQGRRCLPTPCRARTPFLDMPGPTLLEEASRLCDCPAFYLAATLLETLEEHFWGPSSCQEARQCQSVPPANPAVTAGKTANRIDLIAAIPPTAYQRSVEELQRLVPPPSCLHSDPDWLDTDLSHLLTCKAVPDKWKCKFANFVSWHTHAQSALHRLEIFTDGSADGAQTAVPSGAPCAWAFSVWAVTADGRFLVGWAAHAAVPPDTPFSLGEIDDSAITSELLALGWAIIWTLEFGSRYPVPIVFCYDSTAAGHGIFGSWLISSLNMPGGQPKTSIVDASRPGHNNSYSIR